jgi:hypothetical protein
MIRGVDLIEGPSDAVATGAGLAIGATAGDRDENIVLILGRGDEKGLTDNGDKLAQFKVLIDLFAVDSDLSLAFAKEDAGGSAFAAAGSDSKVPDHPNFPLLDSDGDRRLSRMRMIRARIYLGVLVELSSERPLGEHAAERIL